MAEVASQAYDADFSYAFLERASNLASILEAFMSVIPMIEM